MKRRMSFVGALLLSVMLVGCSGSGISQEDYDKVVAERDILQTQVEQLQKEAEENASTAANDTDNLETQILIAEYIAAADAEYTACIRILDMAAVAVGEDTMKDTYDSIHNGYAKYMADITLFKTTGGALGKSATEIALAPPKESWDKLVKAVYETVLPAVEDVLAYMHDVSIQNSGSN